MPGCRFTPLPLLCQSPTFKPVYYTLHSLTLERWRHTDMSEPDTDSKEEEEEEAFVITC